MQICKLASVYSSLTKETDYSECVGVYNKEPKVRIYGPEALLDIYQDGVSTMLRYDVSDLLYLCFVVCYAAHISVVKV